LKKSYVASDHVSNILRNLPGRWRPKVTTIQEAKDLNTLLSRRSEGCFNCKKPEHFIVDCHDLQKEK